MSHFLRDHLERNYVSCMAGQFESRRDYIAQNPKRAARSADLALLSASKRYPCATAKLLGLTLPEGLEYAGAGSAHTVVRGNSAVMKIHRASEFMSDSERGQLAEQQTRQHRKLIKFIGVIAVPQATGVDAHPLKLDHSVVISQQADMNFKDLGLFSAYTPEMNQKALEEAKQQYPGIEYPLFDLIEGGKKLYEETGMLLDTSGQNNIVVAEGELRCLDGLPISDPTQGDIQRVMGQLNALAAHL